MFELKGLIIFTKVNVDKRIQIATTRSFNLNFISYQ